MRRALVGFLVVLSANLAIGASGAGGLDWTHTPASGPAGTVVTVEGVCQPADPEYQVVSFTLGETDGEESTVLGQFEVTAGVPWEFEVEIPEGTAPGEYELGKQCHRVDGEGNHMGGEATTRRPFTVTAPATTTTSTTTTTEAPETGVAPVEVTPPTFTG